MFRIETTNEHLSLQAPISIDESIQLANIVGGLIVTTLNVVANDPNEGSTDGNNSLEEHDISFTFGNL